ncbi:hypothetical protein B296_00029855 [Ensete ventricosum]|uniref:Uncharacterized protein n=1 Tax=Ensete ventricosum TaxID=4639 RepID=A0A426ZBZ0_ENSVE|nr:hypothetical protein B296_00029855 [Ensete ventricosum]
MHSSIAATAFLYPTPPSLPTSPHLIPSPAISAIASSSPPLQRLLPPATVISSYSYYLATSPTCYRSRSHLRPLPLPSHAFLCHRDPHATTLLSSLPLPSVSPRQHIGSDRQTLTIALFVLFPTTIVHPSSHILCRCNPPTLSHITRYCGCPLATLIASTAAHAAFPRRVILLLHPLVATAFLLFNRSLSRPKRQHRYLLCLSFSLRLVTYYYYSRPSHYPHLLLPSVIVALVSQPHPPLL